MKWRRISRATKLLSRMFKILKIKKNQLFFLFQNFLPQNQNFQKPYQMLEGNGWWICAQNFKSISSKMAEIWHKTCRHVKSPKKIPDPLRFWWKLINRHFSCYFGTIQRFSEFYFLTDFDASKSVLGPFFAFFEKIWPKNMYGSSKSRNFLLDLFLSGDLRWPWTLLWSNSTVNDTYKCQRHYPYRLVGFVCA